MILIFLPSAFVQEIDGLPRPPNERSDLSNGTSLIAAIALYCPSAIPVKDVLQKDVMAFVCQFSADHLPYLGHPSIEELHDVRGSQFGNLMAECMLAELFVSLEERPFDASIVVKPGATLLDHEGELLKSLKKLRLTLRIFCRIAFLCHAYTETDQRPPSRGLIRPRGGSAGPIPDLRPSLNTSESTRLITGIVL